MTRTFERPRTFADRVSAAANSHDIDRLLECFTEDYVNESPVHPARGFRGREQVRRNWSQIFETVPDVTTRVLRSDQFGDTVWSEWEMTGTRVDGSPHLMRGVMIFEVDGDQATAVRFYLEPVDLSGLDVDDFMRRLLDRP